MGDLDHVLDKKKYRRKVLLYLASSPFTLMPVGGGMTLLAGIWALSFPVGMALFGALSMVAGGLGVFLTRIIMGSDSAHQAAMEELIEEANEIRWNRLQDLHKRLSSDRDKRDEKMLMDLIRISEKLAQDEGLKSQMSGALSYEIVDKATRLYEGCIHSLERNLELRESAKKIKSKTAKKELKERREALLDEIASSITHLGKILADVKDQSIPGGQSIDLASMRKELDESIEVAKRVESRLENWSSESFDSELE